MTHAQYRLLERYGVDTLPVEIEALEYMIARHLVPWQTVARGRGGALVIRVRTWGRTLYAVWCPVRLCILTFLTRNMARRYRSGR